MNRRELLKTSFLAALTAPLISRPVDDFNPNDLADYRGFKLRWRGFYALPNSDCVIGQMIAYNPHLKDGWGFHVYSSYPGGTGRFFEGQLFDTSIQDSQQCPTCLSSKEALMRWRTEAFDRLVDYIDEHYEELTHEPQRFP